MRLNPEPLAISVHALSVSDALGYRAQQAVADAVSEGDDYRIVGGSMVRLLLYVYPTPNAVPRSTRDADTAVDDIDVIASFAQSLEAADFDKRAGNVYVKELGGGQEIEVNLLLARSGPQEGVQARAVPGVGQVDTLPELHFAMAQNPLLLDVEAHLGEGETLTYQTRIPDVETAVILKAHSWSNRRAEKDLVDLWTLLEIREAHPDTPWSLDGSNLMGRRRDVARILHDIGEMIVRKKFPAPDALERRRFAALVAKHIGRS